MLRTILVSYIVGVCNAGNLEFAMYFGRRSAASFCASLIERAQQGEASISQTASVFESAVDADLNPEATIAALQALEMRDVSTTPQSNLSSVITGESCKVFVETYCAKLADLLSSDEASPIELARNPHARFHLPTFLGYGRTRKADESRGLGELASMPLNIPEVSPNDEFALYFATKLATEAVTSIVAAWEEFGLDNAIKTAAELGLNYNVATGAIIEILDVSREDTAALKEHFAKYYVRGMAEALKEEASRESVRTAQTEAFHSPLLLGRGFRVIHS